MTHACFSLPFMGRDVGAKRRQGGVRLNFPTRSLRDHPPHSGEGERSQVFENQENATKISATTATSTVRVMKVSMAAVPNEA